MTLTYDSGGTPVITLRKVATYTGCLSPLLLTKKKIDFDLDSNIYKHNPFLNFISYEHQNLFVVYFFWWKDQEPMS